MSPIQVNGVEHIGIFANDTEALAVWYGQHFAAREISRSEGDRPIIFLSFGGGALLELIPAPGESPAIPTDHGHLCLSVSSLDEAVERLAQSDIELDRPVFEAYDGSRVAFFRDPEGNLLQFAERVRGSAVHQAVFGI